MTHTSHHTPFYHIGLIILLALSLTSCFDDKDMEIVDIIRPDPQEVVTATIHGVVYDESGAPAVNAKVRLLTEMGSNEQQTDDHGYFLFVDQRVVRSAFLSSGDARQKVYIVDNQVAYTEMHHPQKVQIDGFDAQTGGLIGEQSMSLNIPPDALELNNGDAYNGQVQGYITTAYPSDDDFYQSMMGDLSGIDESGNRVALRSIGMLSINLFTAAGQALNLKDGEVAELSVNVPSTGLWDGITNEIALWNFNEPTSDMEIGVGEWVQQGVAQLKDQNTFFQGVISQLGVWNFDDKSNPIDISGRVQLNFNGITPEVNAGHYQIFIASEEFGKRGGFSAPNGEFNFNNYPKDEIFTLSVLDDCQDVVFEKQFGPFSSDQVLEEIEIDINRNHIDLSGKIQDCAGQGIMKGLVFVQAENDEVFVNQFEDGDFSMALDKNCFSNDEILISFMDRETQELSAAYPIQLNTTNQDVGSISFCPQSGEFLEYTLEGLDNVMCTNPLINLQPSPIFSNLGCGNLLLSILDLNKKGSYTSGNKFSLTIGSDFYSHADPEDFVVHISEFGDGSGDRISGTMVGYVRKALGGGQFGPPLRFTSSFTVIND